MFGYVISAALIFVESGDLIGYPAGTKFSAWRAVDIPANVFIFPGL